MTDQPQANDDQLATLLQLGRRARECQSAVELRFLLVNESLALLPYRQSAFWSEVNGVEVLSGVSSVERHAPYTQWLNDWFKSAPKGDKTLAFQTDLRLLSKSDNRWQEWLPAHLVSVYLPPLGRFKGGRLMLARDTLFSQAELALLQEWCDIWRGEYQHKAPISLIQRMGLGVGGRRSFRWLARFAVVALLIAASQIQVSLSVLAPAELIPLNPAVVRAPMDGILRDFQIEPNQTVVEGAPLFEFDRVALENRLEVSRRALLTSEAEYRLRTQRALFDADSKAQLAVLKSQIDEKQVEVNYLEALNERSLVRSPRDGIVLLDDAADWLGRPLVTGERVLVVANERDTQIEAWLSPSDMLPLDTGAKMSLFLAADPNEPLIGSLTYIAHQPELRPDGNYAYRVRGALLNPDAKSIRVGLKGTARLEGEQVSLVYWIIRRPLAGLRGWLGV